MRFLQRRAILKRANCLELTPLRVAQEEIGPDNKVVILFPRFLNKFANKHLVPKLKNPYIKIKLDEIGSLVWLLIDGKLKVSEIAAELTKSDEKQTLEAMESRLAGFLSMLYEQRMISFVEIHS